MISLEFVSKRYAKSDRQVLDNLTVSFQRGRINVIMGPSGAGKSTLLQCIMLMEKPDKGSVLLNGTILRPGRMPPGMAGVLQPPALFRHMTVLENVCLAPKILQKRPEAEILLSARTYLDRFGLSDKENAYPHELSGGETQRAALIRAVMLKPILLIMDEPTNALNREWIQALVDFFLEMKREGTTLILSTHHAGFAEQVGDVLFRMPGDGSLQEDPLTIQLDRAAAEIPA